MSKLLTMDTMGYISDPSLIIDRVMRNFFVANYSQTNVFYGQIKSLPWLIAKHPVNYFHLKEDIQDALGAMLEAYFDTVSVTVDIQPKNESTDVDQIITVDCKVTRGLKQYSAGRLLSIVKNRVSKIEEL